MDHIESRYAHETRISLLGNRTHINPLLRKWVWLARLVFGVVCIWCGEGERPHVLHVSLSPSTPNIQIHNVCYDDDVFAIDT